MRKGTWISIRSVALAMLAVTLASCGGSSGSASTSTQAHQAPHQAICTTVGRIQTEVKELTTTPLKPANLGVLLTGLQSIQSDLQTLGRQARSLTGTARTSAMSAESQFRGALSSLGSSIGQSSSLTAAVPKVRSAFRKLDAAYQTAFTPLHC